MGRLYLHPVFASKVIRNSVTYHLIWLKFEITSKLIEANYSEKNTLNHFYKLMDSILSSACVRRALLRNWLVFLALPTSVICWTAATLKSAKTCCATSDVSRGKMRSFHFSRYTQQRRKKSKSQTLGLYPLHRWTSRETIHSLADGFVFLGGNLNC